ncbi:MAG: hypothetical protein CM1200mP28_13280 [Deltaproteobacteria bacterium]|nr:MAG: hypothetical protein CM1200mP28_13280 [Deltaproteobacteria bacterium]
MLSVRKHFVPTIQKNGVEIREHHIYRSHQNGNIRGFNQDQGFSAPYLQELIGPAYHLQTPLNILQEGSI